MATTDVGVHQRRARSTRLQRLAMVLAPMAALLILRDLFSRGMTLPSPHIPAGLEPLLPAMALITVLALVMVVPLLGAGRSPHILYRPNEINMRFDDVRGSDGLVDEVVKTLNLFLAHRTFAEQMGGSPRRAILFEGPPGTGKTYMAKAMAAEAGVPFLFVSSSAFQSMFYGQTNRKIRSYFKALRTLRPAGGRRHRLHRGDRRHRRRPGRHGQRRHREGIAGVVNELLIQLQSFDQPPGVDPAARGVSSTCVNAWLPVRPPISTSPPTPPANILVIGATNRAADLDPALVRPGRFDRSIYFDLPVAGRAARDPRLLPGQEGPRRRARRPGQARHAGRHDLRLLAGDARAPARRGAGLGAAPRRRPASVWDDIQQAKMTEEIGLAQPVEYTEAERRTIATHEAGHATVAWLVGKGRKLEVLSIIKRKDALGLLSPLRGGGAVHQDQVRDRGAHPDRLRRHGGRGDVLRRDGSGVAGDLQAATSAACQMVGQPGHGRAP